MKMKKVLAVLMSLCMVTGVVSYGAPALTHTIKAQASAADDACFSYDENSGVLFLRGELDGDKIRDFCYKQYVKYIIATESTVFPEDCSKLFSGYKNCTTIDISEADTSKVKDMNGMFTLCTGLKNIYLSGIDTSNVTNMGQMFYQCSALTELDVSGFDTSKVTDMSSMFGGCFSLPEVDVSGFDTSNVENMQSMFCSCYAMTSIDVSKFDTSKVSNMAYMFENCANLTEINMNGFDTSKVTDMGKMFSKCACLTTLDVSGFDTGNVTTMDYMFYNCFSLTSLDVSSFDTSNVTNMSSMFERCNKLRTLDVSKFNTYKVRCMDGMFKGCANLTALDLSEWVTSNVDDYYDSNGMASMFFGCTSLTELDLSSFDTSKIKGHGLDYAFGDCKNLRTITLGEKFKNITADVGLPNGEGWVNANAPTTVISGDGENAVIENSGKNTYKQYIESKLNCPAHVTYIKVEYSEKYHQVRFRWNKVWGADRYGIAVYLAGKWRIQTQDIADNVYTTPKNLVPGETYKVAIAARVNGIWDTKSAIRNAVTITVK